MRHRIGLFVLVAGLIIVGYAATALAQGQEVVRIPVSDIAYGTEGVWKLRAGPVPGPPVGYVCNLTIRLENGNSTHPDTDLRVLIGGVVVRQVDNFEDEPYEITTAAVGGVRPNGGPVTVEWRPGPDQITSSGGEVALQCEIIVVDPPPPVDEDTTTTTGPPPVDETTTTTSMATTTTLSPPPEGPVPAGGGAMAAQSSGWVWILGGLVFLGLSGLAWAVVAGGTRKETPWR